MLTAFVMIMAGGLIIWIISESSKILLMLWMRVGYQLFETIAIHSDEENGSCYGVTFTNDEQWQEKMLKDLKEMAEKQVRSEGR